MNSSLSFILLIIFSVLITNIKIKEIDKRIALNPKNNNLLLIKLKLSKVIISTFIIIKLTH